jgi:hypothetical protein
MISTNKHISSILSETSNIYGSLDYVFHLLELNPIYEILDELPVNTELQYDSFKIPIYLSTASTITTNEITVVMGDKQDLFDMCIRYYGDLTNIINLMVNNDFGTFSKDFVGTLIKIKNPNKENKSVNYFDLNKIKLATGLDYHKKGNAFNISFNISFD